MNNVDIGKCKEILQYFWDPEPKNDEASEASIWCLGRKYESRPEARSNEHQQSTAKLIHSDQAQRVVRSSELISDWPIEFRDDFESKFWFTYRSDFPPIPKSDDPNAQHSMSLGVKIRSQFGNTSGFTTDTGWGCMIRSGQSLLANALSMVRLGKDWRRGTTANEESALVALFADDPRAPFSVHRFVEHGSSACGKYPGEWFGPSATARCVQALSTRYPEAGLEVYVTSDGSDVYEDQFRDIAARDDSKTIRPTLILLGVRLGIERITPVYWGALQEMLRLPQSVGIAGGRPSSSHYFIGVQDNYYFYLDPHHTRNALRYITPTQMYTDEELNSCHTRRLRRLHVKDMDPSMLLGFLIKDEADWTSWKEKINSRTGKQIVHIFQKKPDLYNSAGERQGALYEVETLDDEE